MKSVYVLPLRLLSCASLPHLYQCHMGAQSQQDLLGLGGVGVIPVFVQPMFQWSGHVLQHLSLVANFDPIQTRPGGVKSQLIDSPGPMNWLGC